MEILLVMIAIIKLIGYVLLAIGIVLSPMFFIFLLGFLPFFKKNTQVTDDDVWITGGHYRDIGLKHSNADTIFPIGKD